MTRFERKRKPTRRDLLVVLHRLQFLIGSAHASHGNDRDPNGFELGQRALDEAFDLCVEARAQDDPLDGKPLGPWGG